MAERAAASYDRALRASGLPALEARVLLEHASGQSRTWLLAHGEETAAAGTLATFRELTDRRRAGAPIAYLVGRREFFGRAFRVTPAVLIPRPDTERLVELALERLPPGGSLADLGTGSGCVMLTIAAERPDAHVVGTDRSLAALAVAADNAAALGLQARIELRAGDWTEALEPGRRFDLIVANPPYVASEDRHLRQGDLRFEPVQALDAGSDGLDAIRRIVGLAPAPVAPGGWLLLEHGC
ncbi:MAG: peptide chain release factor N(5)-glutamine methyltransferase, partial [Burkholderiales bacterium]